MEHEVFVPFPARRLREALADPVRVARAVPGLQQDASAVTDSVAETDGGSSPGSGAGQDAAGGSAAAGHGRDAGVARVAGRLKVRVAGHTITYRGAFCVTSQADGSYAVEGDATEVRGAGAVKLALTLRLLPAEGGTTLAFGGTASGDGRLAELPRDAVTSTGARLLTRFGEALTTDLASRPGSEPAHGAEPTHGAAESGHRAESETGPSAGNAPAAGSEREPAPEPAPEAEAEAEAETEAGPETEAEPEAGLEADAEGEAVPGFEADVTSSSFDSSGEDDEFGGEDFVAEAEAEARGPGRADAMAEAAHARRTMIGRSAEEVDHAPPRGRYAPVPPPEATAARDTLRWAAPAAALALASAIALTRVLRKRR
ncbi:carbon monoxide dehydrogenase [Streptomyces sp. NBC_00659]|uniref:carbon monoxide dehydrogenase n=1 Tax=Streptomyces sp. NBC_00659 TaxID=2903669 RepID=UPI002E326B3E|nr:carbon monoxide dehydrogenase [Streptomyces sp. NBC_00659]